MERQDLWLTDNNGDIIRLKNGHNNPVLDYRKQEAREMWTEGEDIDTDQALTDSLDDV